jgi:hypothetical protein
VGEQEAPEEVDSRHHALADHRMTNGKLNKTYTNTKQTYETKEKHWQPGSGEQNY